jgi:hypothetical protein
LYKNIIDIFLDNVPNKDHNNMSRNDVMFKMTHVRLGRNKKRMMKFVYESDKKRRSFDKQKQTLKWKKCFIIIFKMNHFCVGNSTHSHFQDTICWVLHKILFAIILFSLLSARGLCWCIFFSILLFIVS